MSRFSAVLVCCMVVGGCHTGGSKAVLWQPAPPRTSQVGTVVHIAEVPSYNASSDAQRNSMQMYGAAGSLAAELLGHRPGYPVYRVKVSEEDEMMVASREKFVIGDCVRVSYQQGEARRYFGLGEALLDKAEGCAPGLIK